MNLSKRLQEWHEQHVIDDTTRDAIQAYEATRPQRSDTLWRYGLFGLGGLCVCLGVLFIIAANWSLTPFPVKLGTATLGNLALGAFVWYRVARVVQTEQQKHITDLGLCFLACGQLGLMALIGQYLHSNAPIEDVILYWAALVTPMLLLAGSSKLSAALLLGLGIHTISHHLNLSFERAFPLLATGAVALYLGANLPRLRQYRPHWMSLFSFVGQGLFYILCLYLLLTAKRPDNTEIIMQHTLPMIVFGLLFACLAHFRFIKGLLATTKEKAQLYIMAYAGIAAALLGLVPEETIAFCLFFLGFGWVAWRFHSQSFVTLSILAIAGRLIIYFIAASDNMLISGIALLVIGCGSLLLIKKLSALSIKENAA